MSGEYVPRLDSFKDLGVIFDCQMKFTQHFDAIIKKAFRMLGFLIRTSRYFSCIESLLILYKTLVCCQLEYASIVWSPTIKTHIDAIEKIQRRFTKFVYRKFHIPEN